MEQRILKNKKITDKYPKILVLTCIIALMTSYSLTINCLGIFVVPMMNAFSFSHASVSAIVTVKGIGAIIGAKTAAAVIEKKGPRFCMVFFGLVFVLTMAAMAFGRALWQFYGVAFIMGIAEAGTTLIPVSVLINNWFDSSKRGSAIGIAYMGTGLGGFLFNPVINAIIERWTWDIGFLFMGCVLLVIYVPLVFTLIVPSPPEGMFESRRQVDVKADQHSTGHDEKSDEASADTTDGASADTMDEASADTANETFAETTDEKTDGNFDETSHERSGETAGEKSDGTSQGIAYEDAIRSSTFWILGISVLLIAACSMAFVFNMAPYLIDTGISAGLAAAIVGINSAAIAAGKILIGVISDRSGRFAATAIGFGALALCIIAGCLVHSSVVWMILMLVFSGFGNASVTVMQPLLVSYFFGEKDFTRIMGQTMMMVSLGAASGPLLTGLIIDAAGSFRIAYVVLIILTIISTALVLMQMLRVRKDAFSN